MKAYMIGSGIGSLAAAAFMIRDGGVPGSDITIYERLGVLGGCLDGARLPDGSYSVRGGRMLTFDHYECTWDLLRTIPSLEHSGQSVRDETEAFNELYKAHSQARLVDKNRHKIDVSTMGFSMADRLELVRLAETSEEKLGLSRITDWLSPAFFNNNFWYMWQTTFAFQAWHSAVEFKRYLHRFMSEFPRIETLAGVRRTVYNQYDSITRPVASWLASQGVKVVGGTQVTDMQLADEAGKVRVTGLSLKKSGGETEIVSVGEDDLVFLQNGSMTDASSLGSMTAAPPHLTKVESEGWKLWEKVAEGRPEFGNPAAFNSSIPESYWESFTVTCRAPAYFDKMEEFSGNEAGTGGLVTFKDFELAYVGSALSSAPFRGPAQRRASVLGICPAPRPDRRFRRQIDDGLHRRGDSYGAVRPSQFRPQHLRWCHLHTLPDALHHEHVHAAVQDGSPAAGAGEFEEPRLREPVRRNPR